MTSSELCESFNKLAWHDSKLRSFAVVREGNRDDVVLHLKLRGVSELELTRTTVILQDAAYLKAELDLDGKYQCADEISSATCKIESDFKKELLESQFKYSPTALNGYYYFDVYLIPPGGRIQVFARSFRLAEWRPT